MDIENPYRKGLASSSQRSPLPATGTSVLGRIKFVVITLVVLAILGIASMHVHSTPEIDQISSKLMSLRGRQSLRGSGSAVTPEEGYMDTLNEHGGSPPVHRGIEGDDQRVGAHDEEPGKTAAGTKNGLPSQKKTDGSAVYLTRIITAKPTAAPTFSPTAKPTAAPTAAPTQTPTAKPTVQPTAQPTAKRTENITPKEEVAKDAPAPIGADGKPHGVDPGTAKLETLATAGGAEKKVDYCSGNVDPWENVPVENWKVPTAASMKEAKRWKKTLQDFLHSVSSISYGGPKLRKYLQEQVEILQIDRFETFCKYA
jgi:hypothetical protein